MDHSISGFYELTQARALLDTASLLIADADGGHDIRGLNAVCWRAADALLLLRQYIERIDDDAVVPGATAPTPRGAMIVQAAAFLGDDDD
jgi:hypothetical protein